MYRISTCGGGEQTPVYLYYLLVKTPDLSVYFAVDSLAFSANFRLGVVNAPIPGWDFLLPWGIFPVHMLSFFGCHCKNEILVSKT